MPKVQKISLTNMQKQLFWQQKKISKILTEQISFKQRWIQIRKVCIMYLSELRSLSDALVDFFEMMPNPSKLPCKTLQHSFHHFSGFYMSMFLLQKKIRGEIRTLEALLEEESDIQEDGDAGMCLREEIKYQQSENIEPNLISMTNEVGKDKDARSMPKIERRQGLQLIKLKNWKSWSQSPCFHQIMENLKCLLKYQNKIEIFRAEISEFTDLLQTTQADPYSPEPQYLNTHLHFQSSIHLDPEELFDHVIAILEKCSQSLQQFQKIQQNQTKRHSENNSLSNVSSRSLLTEMLNKSQLITTPTKGYKRQYESQQSQGTGQNQKRKRLKSIRSIEPPRLIIQKIDLQNYQIKSKPKQKKANNMNYGQCSKCTIF